MTQHYPQISFYINVTFDKIERDINSKKNSTSCWVIQ